VGAERQIMSSPLVVPLALFAALTLILTIYKAAKIRDIEVEIRRRMHQEEKEHRRNMQELEVELERTEQARSISLGAIDLQNEH
jgi:DNA-directed RNA polymerase specialized sigma subunit